MNADHFWDLAAPSYLVGAADDQLFSSSPTGKA
jgi:hypothetical protein